MSLGGTIKCPICGRPYKWFGHYAGDQSACPMCRYEAEQALKRPDTPEQRRRRERFFR